MKRFSLLAISVITAWGFSTPLSAQSKAIDSQQIDRVAEISPYDLVTASYQGRFIEQGIPSGSKLITATHINQIDAEDLVKGAISAGKLSEATLEDRGYLYRVELIIDHLSRS